MKKSRRGEISLDEAMVSVSGAMPTNRNVLVPMEPSLIDLYRQLGSGSPQPAQKSVLGAEASSRQRLVTA